MFSFGNPNYLYLLLLIPVIVLLYFLSRMARKKKLKNFGKKDVIAGLMPDVSKYKPWIKLVLELIVLTLIIIVLARPRAGSTVKTERVNGIEVMVDLDVSNSMLASSNDDPNGVSRLQRSKLILERMMDKLSNDKVGLIVFAGNAYTQLPITNDYVSAKMFLNEINTNMVPTQGTAIGAAIKMAINSFTGNSKTQKAIIVITDGENHEDDAVAMAKEAKSKGIMVNVIGVGTTKGGPIRLSDGTFMKDDGGNVVTTRLNDKMGQEIAAAGGGIYISGSAPDAISTLTDQLDKLAKTNLKSTVYSTHDEQFPIFAWLALIFLIIEMLVVDKKNSWLRKYNFFTKENKKNEKNK